MAENEGAPQRSEAVVVCLSPDICLSPDKPCPYQIVAFYSDAQNQSANVNLNTFAATTLASRIACVTGNEPGIGGGVCSGVNLGYCRPVEAAASTVRVNGQFMLRHGTEFEMNCPGPEGSGNTRGKTVYMTSAPLASVASGGEIQGDTDPPPQEPEKIGFWGQIGGFFVGAGKAGWELIQFGGSVIQYGMDTGLLAHASDAAFDLFGSSPPPWLPSAMRGRQTTQSIMQVGEAIWNDPWLIWEGIKAPYVEAWAQGRYGEAIGRGTFEVLSSIAGAKGADKLGKLGGLASSLNKVDDIADVFTVLKRVDTIAPDEFAGVADELVNLGRVQDRLGDVVDAARKSGALEDLLDLGKLTPDEIDALVKAGKLTPEEAAIAKQAAARAAGDGATVHKSPPFSRADARRLILDSENRQFGNNVGHSKDHIPYDKDPKSLAEARPNKQNTTTWRSASQTERDLRDIMNANKDKLDALKPGEVASGIQTLGVPRQGFNSILGAPATPVNINQATWSIGRLPNGQLHLLHFSPKLP